MNHSPYDPHPDAPQTFRERLSHRFKRTVEPLAIHLLDWCRSLNGRLDGVEARVVEGELHSRDVDRSLDAVERRFVAFDGRFAAVEDKLKAVGGQVRATLDAIDGLRADTFEGIRAVGAGLPVLEAAIAEGRARVEAVASGSDTLRHRADQADWGREAIVERMNRDDARIEGLGARIEALDPRIEALDPRIESLVGRIEGLDRGLVETYWAREALVERFVRYDAAQEILRQKVEVHLTTVEEQLSLPLAFGLDALAMGRRIAALEDQVEALLVGLSGQAPAAGVTLVPFPHQGAGRGGEAEKAAG